MAGTFHNLFTSAVVLLLAVSGELAGEAAPLPQGPYYKVYGNYIAREGQTVSMDCHLTKQLAIVGFLSSTEWVKDGKVIQFQTRDRLTLHHVTRQDAGHYQCGEPGSDLDRMGLDLHVFVIGDVLPRPDVINQHDGLAVLGRPYSLQCIIRGTTYIANEATVYTWYKDSVEVKGQTGAVLLLPNVTQADEGKYRCTAREGPVETTSPASFDFDLTVYVSPQVRIKPSAPVVRGILGENLTLTCEVTRSNPSVPRDGYSWSYLPCPEAEEQVLGAKGRNLTLGPLTLGDRGQYICQARNDQWFDKTRMSGHASVTVDVVYLENLTLTPDLEVNEGDSLTLTCGVDSHPTARLAWTVDGQEVRHVTDNLDHYVILSAACSDSTNYTCGASNTEMPGRERNATTRVHVHCKQVPDPVPTPDKTLTDVTTILQFSLPQVMMTPSMVVVHPRGHDVISIDQDCSIHVTPAFQSRCLQPSCDLEHRRLTFTLTQVTEEDEGDYTCVEEGTRRPVSRCGTQLLVQKDSVDMSQPEYQHSVALVITGVGLVFVFAAVLIGVALGIQHHEKIRNFCEQLKHTLTSHRRTGDPVLLEISSESQEAKLEFEKLYEKGQVYIFPKLVSQTQETPPSPDPDIKDENEPLLSPDNVKEDTEFRVKDLLRFTFEKLIAITQESLPSFVFHNTRLSKQENVILVVDRFVGVLLIVVNTTTHLLSKSSLHQAVQHLLEARDKVRHKLQGLVGSCDVTAVLALPCLTQAESNDVRKHIKILRSHPDVELLPGLDIASYHQWMEGLRGEKASKVWRSSSQGDDPDAVYKMAASSFLTLTGCGGPGESPHSPDPAQSWLLTPAQVEVRDSTAKLLHIRGPPGSGKTTLLVHRARQWLAEGKAVILGIGKAFYDVKLAQLEKAVRKGQTEEAIGKLRVCRTYQDMVRETRELRGSGKSVEICQVVDILHNDPASFQKSLSSVKAKEPLCVWTTSWRTLSDINPDLSKEATDLGWESIKLPDCIRCTKDTVELLNLLRKDVFHSIPSCSLPRDPDIPAWRVVDHCLHPDHVNTMSRCDGCKTEMSQVLPSPEEGVVWSNWIALHTGNKYKHVILENLREALQYFGVPTFYESKAYVRQDSASTSPAPAPEAPVQGFATFRERVLRGVDADGQPTVHLVETGDFTGLERKGVILVHWDERDNDPGQQNQADRDARLKDHRRQWMKAVPVSKGQVILLLLTPSPARSLLGLPESVVAQY